MNKTTMNKDIMAIKRNMIRETGTAQYLCDDELFSILSIQKKGTKTLKEISGMSYPALSQEGYTDSEVTKILSFVELARRLESRRDEPKPKNGRMTRATHDWNEPGEDTETIQHGGSEFGGYYLGAGYISYSGSLDSGIKKNQLHDTGEVKNGRVWVFKDDFWGAGRGVDYTVQFRVFEVV